MKRKRILFIIAAMLFVIMIVVGRKILITADSKDKEIIFIAAQEIPSKNGTEMAQDILILINKKGEYFAIPREEGLQHGKSYLSIMDYYSNKDYQVDGKILNSSEMKKICESMEKIDIDNVSRGHETIKQGEWSSNFELIGMVNISSEQFDKGTQRREISLYKAVDMYKALQIDHLVDEYAIQIVNQLLEVWPINNGERYLNREKELTLDMEDRLIR